MGSIKVYNTLTGRKEIFEPVKSGHVGMYVCGVTVYDICHIGHARSAIVFDVIRRYLKYKGYNVTFVKNFTDIDDKIINRSREEGIPWYEVAEKYIAAYYQDMELIGVEKADIEPRATGHIEDMIRIIESLIKKGHAYRADGDVYYRVKSFKEYGKLSKRNLEEMLAGARVEIGEHKEDPLDFALWKASKSYEPSWSSPWGPGRPGWHIECSTMSMKYLGVPLDIHGGGKDLIFPHHENEIAQSEGYTGKIFVRYWLHNGFVNINKEKMSKSLGNFFTIREVFEKYPYSEAVTREVLRYFLLSTHYRNPVDFSDEAMKVAHLALDGIYAMLQKLDEMNRKGLSEGRADTEAREAIHECRTGFEKAMDDDFNTAEALGCIQKFKRDINLYLEKGFSGSVIKEIIQFMNTCGSILGVFLIPPEEWEFFKGVGLGQKEEIQEEELLRLVKEREEARKRKDWARADRIREMLKEKGIILEDRPDGTTRIKR